MSIGSVIDHISGRDDVEEFTVLVREVQVYLKTNDESFTPKLRIKVWKGDLVPEPYTFTVSHYVHTPIQSSPYFVAANDLSQGKFDEEKAAHIRAESRIESLNSELNKKNVALLETLVKFKS